MTKKPLFINNASKKPLPTSIWVRKERYFALFSKMKAKKTFSRTMGKKKHLPHSKNCSFSSKRIIYRDRYLRHSYKKNSTQIVRNCRFYNFIADYRSRKNKAATTLSFFSTSMKFAYSLYSKLCSFLFVHFSAQFCINVREIRKLREI